MLLLAVHAAHKSTETGNNTLLVGLLLFAVVAWVVMRLLGAGSDE